MDNKEKNINLYTKKQINEISKSIFKHLKTFDKKNNN